MRVLITGASGLLGQALRPALAARGHEIVAPDRRERGDLTEIRDWRSPLEGIDAVVHLAALAHARAAEPGRLRKVNVELPLAIGRACAAQGVRLVFMSSVKVHGEETAGVALHEESPLRPADAYARAKADAEAGLCAIGGLQLVRMRPPLVYGPGVKANFLGLMHAVARGWPLPFAGLENRRSLVFAGNLADAVVRCLEAPQAPGRAYLVGDGAAVSTPALCRALASALGRPTRLFAFPRRWLEFAPPMRKLTRSLELDGAALRRELGWTPPYSFEEGLLRTARWYRMRNPNR